MKPSLNDLKYAKNVAIPIVDAVYARYDGQQANVPGIHHLADIHADTGKLKTLAAEADLPTRVLLAAVFADGTLFGAIDQDPATKTGFIAFRGTRKYQEWIDDFLFPAVRFSEIGGEVPLVHSGFHKVYLLARQSLTDQLHLLTGIDRLVVTGHSLGAAVASLCALDMINRGITADTRCWTFASPRTYYLRPKRFNEQVTQSLRVFNPVDIVTHVPSVATGYFHVAGGLGIAPKYKDFHSLNLTYAPGLQKKIDEGSVRSLISEISEDEQIRAILAVPSTSSLDHPR